MKTLSIISATLFLSAAAPALAGPGFDGCYQLVIPQQTYPVFCLEGTTEEGINGAGVRLAIFGNGSENVRFCTKSVSAAMTAQSFSLVSDNKTQLSLENVVTIEGLKKGDAVIGAYHLRFEELNAERMARSLALMNASAECK